MKKKMINKLLINLLVLVGLSLQVQAQNQTINGNLTVQDRINIKGSSAQVLHIRPNSGYPGYIYWAENAVAERGILGFNAGSGDLVYRSKAYSFSNGIERFRITKNGNVGIGTTIPTQKLTVNGTAKAKEIIVEENVGADFVFEEDYKLPSLSDVEQHIKVRKHLPEIPSAEQMIANGVKVGELQMKLLQKIEELTLYVIELEKRDREKEKRIKELERKLDQKNIN